MSAMQEKDRKRGEQIERTLTFLFEGQFSFLIVVFVLSSTPVFTSL